MKALACPSCGAEMQTDGVGYRCPEHGVWQSYGNNLLVLAPTGEQHVRDRFTMPWESRPRE